VEENMNVKEKSLILHLDFEVENINNGVVKNIAGNGMNAVIVGKPEFVAGPTGGNALHFGAGQTFDFLRIEHDPSLNFTAADEFTVDFWYKLDECAKGWENLFSKGSRRNGWYGVWLGINEAQNGGVCWGGDAGNSKIGYHSSREKWHHITVVQKERTLFMLLDGKQVNTSGAVDLISDTALYIGGRNSNASDEDASAQLHGCIDDFKIYNYAFDISDAIPTIFKAKPDTFVYTDENGESISLPYRIFYPSDYDANRDKKYPILFFLHGHGECGTENTAQLQVLNRSNKLLDDIADMDNCLILAPQTYCDGATNRTEWIASGAGIPGKHIWDGGLGGMKVREGKLSEIPYTLGLRAASALLDRYLALDTVDKTRVYIAGISMGGCGTWEMMARRPETFAAAAPVCGSGILSSAETLTKIAIWAFHGALDSTVLPEGSSKMVEAIRAAGGNVAYNEFPGVWHDSWNRAYNAKNEKGQTAAEWLLDQKKADCV
jgi:predicted esterase